MNFVELFVIMVIAGLFMVVAVLIVSVFYLKDQLQQEKEKVKNLQGQLQQEPANRPVEGKRLVLPVDYFEVESCFVSKTGSVLHPDAECGYLSRSSQKMKVCGSCKVQLYGKAR